MDGVWESGTVMAECKIEHLFQSEDLSAGETDALAAYLARFQEPRGYKCQCGEKLMGIFGCFQWGLANGEGFCSACGWPIRMFHRLPQDRGLFTFPLLYHPEDVTEATG